MLCFRETAFGRVGIEDKEGSITRLYLPGRSDAASEGPETALLGEAFAQLEAYTDGKFPEKKDYYLRAAEIAAEIFSVDVKKTWQFGEFLQAVGQCVLPEDACADAKIFETKSRRTLITRLVDWKRREESAYVTSCIYHAMRLGMAADTEKIGLLTIFPRELIAALFLYVRNEA